MLNHVFSDPLELYKYTLCAYVNFLTKIPSLWQKTEHNTVIAMLQLFFFAETIQTLVKKLGSKIIVWYLGDGNLADNYKIVLRDLKKY